MANNYERPEDDFYPTPKWCLDGLFNIIDLGALELLGYNFFEPCKGSGAIYDYFRQDLSDYCSLHEGKDYLKITYEHDPNKVIITNPPFNIARQFLEKSLSEADVVIYLLRLNFLGSGERFELFTTNAPDRAVVLSDRPSFTPDGKTDNSDYAFFIWDKDNVLELKKTFYFIEDPVRAERRAKRKERLPHGK